MENILTLCITYVCSRAAGIFVDPLRVHEAEETLISKL